MTDYGLIEILGQAFSEGNARKLEGVLSDDCVYESDYAQKTIESSRTIIERMELVNSNLTDNDKYTYKIVNLEEIMIGKPGEEWALSDGSRMNSYGLLLYQHDLMFPTSVVLEKLNSEGEIIKIWLSRAKWLFNVDFCRMEIDNDSPRDLPSTVISLTKHDRQVRAMRSAFSEQHLDLVPKEIEDGFYIWRQANDYFEGWLRRNGYSVEESQVFPDCIGYRCIRQGLPYTVYMYAYGTQKTTGLDGDYCSSLLDLDFSADSTVLVTYLQVWKDTDGDKIEYEVTGYSGRSYSTDLWRVSTINGKYILEYYPRQEFVDLTVKLMYAFNRDDLDAYDCIITSINPSFEGFEHPDGLFMNDAFYYSLHNLHEKYGDMKLGYVRFNDVIYSAVPYLEGYGFFDFTVGELDRITQIRTNPFEGRKKNVREFIRTEEKEDSACAWFGDYPALASVKALPPVETERFALYLTFSNGETRKYILPIKAEDAGEEVISWHGYVFTDKIWGSAAVKDQLEAEIKGYPQRKNAVIFKNDFFISGYRCWNDSTPYSEPVLRGDIIYKDDKIRVERIWQWNVNALYCDDGETNMVKTLISGDAFNYYGKSTYVTKDGKRLCSIDYDQIGNFSDGLAKVGKIGFGYGYVNSNLEFAIPMKYENAEDFHEGKARVKLYGRWLYIDKEGNETKIDTEQGQPKYQEICEYSEGLSRVSTMKLGLFDFAYHFDWSEIAGIWGYVNEAGEEVIPPQYICAEDFHNGIAVVCKGKWTIDPKWDNEYNKGRYWSEEMLWGAIDKEGNTVIPFVFDEIKSFYSLDEDRVGGMFMAHTGGWKDGHWGVIDDHGNWLADPVFEDIGYECQDGLIKFYDRDKWDDDALMGLYNLKEKKVVLEPQFYDIDFLPDGLLQVEVNDEKLGRHIVKIIDKTGKEKFHSEYSSIQSWRMPPYHVLIRDDNGVKIGLIDENGNELVPCQDDIIWDGILYDQKRIIFKNGENKGIRDFEGNIIIPAKYLEIRHTDKPLLCVRIGEKDNYKEGILTRDGIEVVPAEYRYIIFYRDNYIVCCRNGHCEMLRLICCKESDEL